MIYSLIYRGKVVGADDPDKLGRLKIEAYPMFKGIEAEHLPWAVPAFPLFSGSAEGVGAFSIPAVGSFVWVFFENGDVDQPVYFAEAPSKLHGIPVNAQGANYPNIKAFRTPSGIEILIDDTVKTVSVTMPAGTSLSITENGITATGLGNASISMDSSGNVTISGATVNINT
jgi:uncharacterized protein involved in type VI secretion and phage assembly